MNSKLVRRHDRDLRPILSSTDGDDNWQSRIYAKAEARQRESKHEEGRARLRKLIGLEDPPRTLREKCLGVGEPKTRQPTFVERLRQVRAERERRERIFHRE
jgi:hypothetical protein